MKALSRKLLQDIKTLRVQIATMALLVACGVAVLVASWSSYISLREAQRVYYEKYRFADLFADLVRGPSSLLASLQKIDSIETVEGRVIEEALLDLSDQMEPALGRVISYSPLSLLNKIYLRQGRLPERGTRLEVLVHESFAKAHHLRPGDTFYMSIKGQREKVLVSGVGISPEYIYALSPLAPFPDDLHFGILWMPEEDLFRLSGMQGAFNNFVFKITSDAILEDVKIRIDEIISSYGTLGAYDRSQQISHIFIQDEIRQQRSMSAVVPGIFIFVASFILHTVISRLVSLQRTQIAALKSLGYSSWELVLHYWKLVTVILLTGFFPALIFAQGIGQWYAYLYQRYFRFPSIDFSLSGEAVLIGAIAGFIPGWIASLLSLSNVFSLNPAEAMRPATPVSFKRTFLEKWSLLNPKNIQSKMVLRNIIARPWRSTLSILGIAAATAILINGSFWSDIVNFLIQRQFRESSREDLEIHFQHPRRLEVISEIKRIPGIYLVEGVRSVAVKMQFRNFTKDTAVISSENPTLRRVLNRQGTPLHVRENQVLLSQYFEKKFNMKSGDKIRLEVSDKSSPPFSVVVGGFVDDVVGSAIYARKEDLHRWLSETPSINTVYVKIDPTQSTSIYIKLKQFPEVISVGVKKLLFQSFTATLSGMILTFTMILILFAVTISGAVLFNMARINLSEKAWELASMKIMGFEVPEVFMILFLEMGVQVLLALIPGTFAGYGLSYLSTRWIHTDVFSFPLVIDIKTYALAVVVIVITYFVTGWFLLFKVRALNMTEALKARE